MSKTPTSVLTFIVVVAFVSTSSADIWNGPSITFTKDDFADWTLPENQDQITPNVAITRADLMGIFNIAQEGSYFFDISPIDTEWAFGTTADVGSGSLTFSDWRTWALSVGGPTERLDWMLCCT